MCCSWSGHFLLQNNPPTIVKERVLGLIQYWADAFRGRPQLVTVGEVYEDLRSQGVEFPPMDLDQLAPVETPSRVSQWAGWVWLCVSGYFTPAARTGSPGTTGIYTPGIRACWHSVHTSAHCVLYSCPSLNHAPLASLLQEVKGHVEALLAPSNQSR